MYARHDAKLQIVPQDSITMPYILQELKGLLETASINANRPYGVGCAIVLV